MKIAATSKLPDNMEDRQQLKSQIKTHINYLQMIIAQNQQPKLIQSQKKHIELLELRLKLIAKCGQMSLVRLNHLEEVFRHYCTHVFRIGKHMTFDRLQYDKVHMTMERFFLFLRDFGLTSAYIQDKIRQILDKQAIITVFKKKSSNARELSFQEFIQCLQKLAVMYWDEKQNWTKKQKALQKKKENRKKLLEKRKRKKEGKSQEEESDKQGAQQHVQAQQAEEHQQIQEHKQEKQEQGEKQEEKNENENDGLIDELMANQDIEDPNQQVKKVAANVEQQNIIARQIKNAAKERQATLLTLSIQEKIEFYYELLGIDTVVGYRKKMTDLNIYQITNKKNSEQKSLSQSKLIVMAEQEEQRLKRLKAKMMQKKEKFKDRPLPKPSNQQAIKQKEKAEQRKQAKKERKEIKEVIKKQQKTIQKKVQYRENQISWEALNQLNLDQLRLKQFNPAKVLAPADDDRYYLEQYGGGPKLTQRLYARERQSLSIVESTKMRAAELEKQQRGKTGKRTTKGGSLSRQMF